MTRPTSAKSDTASESDLRRQLPSVHDLLLAAKLCEAAERYGRNFVLEAARSCLHNWRTRLVHKQSAQLPVFEELVGEVLSILELHEQSVIRRVINGTGILLHTGLGRAPLPQQAIDAVLQAAGYCNVELDLSTGNRTRRHELLEEDLCALTGAEAAMVVNNNAGATGLVLAAFATGRELVVSHGQLIEIGGGFRLPDVFRAYGAKLRAVGTTNRTRKEDFEAAINEHTGALMLIHTSNYQVVGFTEQVALDELVPLAKDRDFPVIHDIGSGALADFSTLSGSKEPLVTESVKQGADLVLFSGDKLLGGPQAGIIVGKRHCIEQLARHPMSRALRVDKMTLAALQATLAIYRRGLSAPEAYDEIPFLKLIRTPITKLEERATILATRLSTVTTQWNISPCKSEGYAGGGALPGNRIDSWAMEIKPLSSSMQTEELSKQLRQATPAVVGHIKQGNLYIDLLGIDSKEDQELEMLLKKCLG